MTNVIHFRQSRQIWRRAHPVKLPCRDTSVHAELAAAYARDTLRMADLESKLALALAADFERMEAGLSNG